MLDKHDDSEMEQMLWPVWFQLLQNCNDEKAQVVERESKTNDTELIENPEELEHMWVKRQQQ